jgi:hypothetical protein
MKLRLHWAEKFNVVRTYPSFELDSERYPELELEMLQVYNAGSLGERERALNHLENKMQNTQCPERGETVFSLVQPQQGDEFTTEFLTPEAGDDVGSLLVSEFVMLEET